MCTLAICMNVLIACMLLISQASQFDVHILYLWLDIFFFFNRIGQSGWIHLHAWLRCIHKFNLKRYDYFTHRTAARFIWVQAIRLHVLKCHLYGMQYTVHKSKKENGSYKLSGMGFDSKMLYCCCLHRVCSVLLNKLWTIDQLLSNHCQ